MIPMALPPDASLCGVTLYHQVIFSGPSWALSNGLARTIGG
jgi:hypothetical protein